MRRLQRSLISVVLVVALLFAVCTIKPQPTYADDTTTILIVLGGVIGGLMIVALIFTFFVRDNPAWMPATQTAETNLRGNPWDRPVQRVRFGFGCATRDGAVPLLCW